MQAHDPQVRCATLTNPRTSDDEGLLARCQEILNDGNGLVRKWATSRVSRGELHGKAVFIKEYLPTDTGVTQRVIEQRVTREQSLAQRLRHWFADQRRMSVPNLLAAFPQNGIVVTEEISGPAIGDLLQSSAKRKVSRSDLMGFFLAGRWLRHFQQMPSLAEDQQRFTDNDPVDVADYCALRLRRIRELGYGWPSEASEQRIQARIRELLSQAEEADRRMVWTHSDYGPQNVLWNGVQVTPLDFAAACLDYPLADVTYFVHRLEMLRIYFPWMPWPVETWKRAFLTGYGRPDAEQSPAYRALMTRHLHCRLQTYVRRKPGTVKEKLHNAWTRRRVHSTLLRTLFAQDAAAHFGG